MASITLTSAPYSGRYMQLECTQTQDISNNKSVINWTLSSIGGSSNFYSTGPTKVYINGVEVYSIERKSYSSQTFPAAKGSVSGTHTVAHNADGSKTITVSFSTAIYYADVSTYSNSWTLDKIPRGAVINSITAFTDENTPTINYTNYAGSGADSLAAFIYANDGTTLLVDGKSISKTANSVVYTLTEAEREVLRKAAKNTNSLTVKFYIRTIIKGVTYWSAPYAINMDVVNANPTATIDFCDSNEATYEVTQAEMAFVRGMSHLTYSISATALKGAEIYGYGVYVGEQSASTANGTIYNVDGDELILVVTDTRGNEYREPIPLYVINYIPVTCSQEATIELNGETEAVITCNITGNYFNSDFVNTDNNLNLYYRIAEGSGEFGEWIYIGTAQEIVDNVYSCQHIINSLNYEKAYTVQIAAQDALLSVNSNTVSLRLTPVFDWSETDFNFNVPLKMNGKDMPVVIEQGAKDGWQYRNWSNGKGEAWKILNHSTNITKSWGALYYGNNTARQNYPFPFKNKPVEQVTLLSGNYAAWAVCENGGVNGAYASGIYCIVSPVAQSASQTYYVSYYVYGDLL